MIGDKMQNGDMFWDSQEGEYLIVFEDDENKGDRDYEYNEYKKGKNERFYKKYNVSVIKIKPQEDTDDIYSFAIDYCYPSDYILGTNGYEGCEYLKKLSWGKGKKLKKFYEMLWNTKNYFLDNLEERLYIDNENEGE